MEPAEHAVGVRVQLATKRFDQRSKRSFVATAGGIHQGLEIVAHGPMTGAPGRSFTIRPYCERPIQMSKMSFSFSVSLDGCLALPGMDLEHPGDPNYDDWGPSGASSRAGSYRRDSSKTTSTREVSHVTSSHSQHVRLA